MRRGIPYVSPPPKPEYTEDSYAIEAKGIPVESRCEVHPGGKRGVVRYVDSRGGGAGWMWCCGAWNAFFFLYTWRVISISAIDVE